MTNPARRISAFDTCWFLFFACVSSAWCLTAAAQLGPTWDEPTYIHAGLSHWRTQCVHGIVAHGTMPLPVDVQTFPLYVYECWRGTPIGFLKDPFCLSIARAGNLLFWWVLLVYGWLFARDLAGRWGGRVAVALLACEPTLLAHAALATTDLSLAACLMALLYHYRMGCAASTWSARVLWPGLWLATAVLAKISGLLYGPLCILAVEIEAKYRRAESVSPPCQLTVNSNLHGGLTPTARLFVSWLQIGFVALLAILVYARNDFLPSSSIQHWAQRLPEGPTKAPLLWLAEHLPVLNEIGYPAWYQFKHNREGHGGTSHALGLGAEPYLGYFPLVMSMKLTASLLIALGALLLLRPWNLGNAAGLAALGMLLLSLPSRIQIGIRLVLPVVAFGIVALAIALVRLGIETKWPVLRRSLMVATAALILWSGAAAVRIWPHGLCYANEFWGGSDRAYLYTGDSNYDWGQGLPELARWQREHDQPEVAVWYFGQPFCLDWRTQQRLELEKMPLDGPEGVREQLRGRIVAVSLTLLYAQGNGPVAVWFRTLQPMDRTRTFFLYDFTREAPLIPLTSSGSTSR